MGATERLGCVSQKFPWLPLLKSASATHVCSLCPQPPHRSISCARFFTPEPPSSPLPPSTRDAWGEGRAPTLLHQHWLQEGNALCCTTSNSEVKKNDKCSPVLLASAAHIDATKSSKGKKKKMIEKKKKEKISRLNGVSCQLSFGSLGTFWNIIVYFSSSCKFLSLEILIFKCWPEITLVFN